MLRRLKSGRCVRWSDLFGGVNRLAPPGGNVDAVDLTTEIDCLDVVV